MDPFLKNLFLLISDGAELHQAGAVLYFSDPEVVVTYAGELLYTGGDIAEAWEVFKTSVSTEKQ